MERWFISLIEHKGFLYWITEWGHHFMKMNLKSKVIEYMRPKIDERLDGENGAAILCCWQDKLIYTVDHGERILLYDLVEDAIETIHIACGRMYLNMFSFAEVIDSKLIIVPTCHPDFFVFDLEERTGYSINPLALLNSGFQQYYAKTVLTDESGITVFSVTTNEMVSFSIDKGISIIFRTKYEGNIDNIINFVPYKDSFCFLDSQNRVYLLDGNHFFCVRQLSESAEAYMLMDYWDEKMIFLPLYEDVPKCLQFEDNSVIDMHELKDVKYTADAIMGKYSGKCSAGNRTFFAMHAGNCIVYLEKDKLSILNAIWPEREDDMKELFYQKRMNISEKGFPLFLYIDYICESSQAKEAEYYE